MILFFLDILSLRVFFKNSTLLRLPIPRIISFPISFPLSIPRPSRHEIFNCASPPTGLKKKRISFLIYIGPFSIPDGQS